MLLTEAARRITEALMAEALLVRIGGDEFVVATTYEPYVKEAERLERQIHQIFEKPFVLDSKELVIGTSVGCAHYPKDGSDFDTLMHKADQRMYMEKQARC